MILTREGKEIVAIYKQNGDEVDEVKDANGRIIYTNTREITGTLPLSFTSSGKPLSDYRISGNTVQDGTPTPDAPVDVVGCGVRTGNLLEITNDIKTSTKWALSPILNNQRYFEVYDITNVVPRGIISAKVFENFEPGYEPGLLVCAITPENTATVDLEYRILTNNGVATPKTFDTTSWDSVYLCIGYGNGFNSESTKQQIIDELFNNWKIMLNAGSTALPYEPYGYKLPISSGGSNLFDYSAITIGERIQWADGNPYTDTSAIMSDYIPVTEGDYALNGEVCIIGYASDKSYVGAYQSGKTWEKRSQYRVPTFTVSSGSNVKFVKLLSYSDIPPITNTLMLNLGSTALPYEPYVEPTETNIYFGEVQSARKIKKLALDGTENWKLSSTTNQFYIDTVLDAIPQVAPMCTHFKGVDALSADNQIVISASQKINIRTTYIQHNLTDWISYLQQQYAAGTPVTVWYVLAVPETGIVNEPLMKIGNYADTISYAQAGVTIPTVSGTNVLDMLSPVKPSGVYIKGKGIKSTT